MPSTAGKPTLPAVQEFPCSFPPAQKVPATLIPRSSQAIRPWAVQYLPRQNQGCISLSARKWTKCPWPNLSSSKASCGRANCGKPSLICSAAKKDELRPASPGSTRVLTPMPQVIGMPAPAKCPRRAGANCCVIHWTTVTTILRLTV